ncbi:MAG: alpha/beta hydrolase [Candidatus Saccharibacteria bacterium]|nr:alpha/beta hydrolase [Candidatus Saccharibacteria bacterium]
MSNPNVIIIHGNGGATIEDIWFPEVKADLEEAGLEVVAQTMPDNFSARAITWLPFLRDILGADENSIIIGHSSGAIAAMRYAQTHRIFGSVIVGAYHTDLGIRSERMSGYFDEPWDWEAIKANQNWVVQFASPSDPYIPIEEPRHIHDQLGTDYHELANRGHFMNSSFPELVKAIEEKLA